MPELSKPILKINYLLILIILTSCHHKSSAEEITTEMQNVYSWAATANMVGNAWLGGVIPGKYAQQTLKKAQEELQKETQKIEKIKASTDTIQHDKSVLLAGVIKLASKTEQMSIAVAQKNRLVMRQQLQELTAEEKSLNIFRTKQQTHEENL